MRLFLTLLVPVSCGLALAACGGGGGGGGGLSKSEYVAQADRICREEEQKAKPIEERVQNLGGDVGAEETLRELKEAFRDLVPIGERLHSRLDELEPPEEIAQDADAYVETVGEGVDVVRRASEVEKLEDLQGIGLAEQQKEVRELSQRLGFKECGS